jgi:hypothetical protein
LPHHLRVLNADVARAEPTYPSGGQNRGTDAAKSRGPKEASATRADIIRNGLRTGLRLGTGLSEFAGRVGEDDFHAPVLLPARLRIVRGNRICLAQPLSLDAIR